MTQTRPKPLPNLPVYAVNWGSDAPVNSVCIRYIDPTLFDHGTYHVSYDYALQVLELLGLPSAPMVSMEKTRVRGLAAIVTTYHKDFNLGLLPALPMDIFSLRPRAGSRG